MNVLLELVTTEKSNRCRLICNKTASMSWC